MLTATHGSSPGLGKRTNTPELFAAEATFHSRDSSKSSGIERFIYASTSSVYGIKKEKKVNEEMSLEPLTDYSRFKGECEKILFRYEVLKIYSKGIHLDIYRIQKSNYSFLVYIFLEYSF